MSSRYIDLLNCPVVDGHSSQLTTLNGKDNKYMNVLLASMNINLLADPDNRTINVDFGTYSNYHMMYVVNVNDSINPFTINLPTPGTVAGYGTPNAEFNFFVHVNNVNATVNIVYPSSVFYNGVQNGSLNICSHSSSTNKVFKFSYIAVSSDRAYLNQVY